MGYCGLGMQRWIYTQKTRRLFQKRSKPDSGGNAASSDSFNQILNSKGKYSKFVDIEKLTPEYKELLFQHFLNDKKIAKQRLIITLLLTLLFASPIAYYVYELSKPIEQSKVRQITKEIFTPNGIIKTYITIDEESNELISVEQVVNDSLVYKEGF